MKIKILALLLLAICLKTYGQTHGNCTCCTPEYRQFDFWVGEWDVFDKTGVKVGENIIFYIQDSCGIQENWTSGAQTGTSYNYYNPTDSTWNQIYLDNTGTLLELKGKYQNGSMVLESEPIQSKKSDFTYRNRITWTLNGDSTVTQKWDIVSDNDSIMYIAFAGVYKRKTE